MGRYSNGKQRRSSSAGNGNGLMDQMQSRATRLLLQYRSQQPETQFWRQEDWSVDYLRDTDPIFRRMKAGQLHVIAQQAIAGIEINSPPPSDDSSEDDEDLSNITLMEVQVLGHFYLILVIDLSILSDRILICLIDRLEKFIRNPLAPQ